jgi:Uma2 family endonuclease
MLNYAMTLALEHEKLIVPSLEIAPRRFSFAEFKQMSDSGLFANQHVELLNEEIFVKGMQGPKHARAIRHLNRIFSELFTGRAVISPQLPLILLSPPPDFVKPDMALLQLPEGLYNNRNPTSVDAILVIEVSDTTLERDQNAKLRAYARNSIPEYWILNLHTNQLEVNRNPDFEDYLETHKYKAGQAIAPLEFTDTPLEWWV